MPRSMSSRWCCWCSASACGGCRCSARQLPRARRSRTAFARCRCSPRAAASSIAKAASSSTTIRRSPATCCARQQKNLDADLPLIAGRPAHHRGAIAGHHPALQLRRPSTSPSRSSRTSRPTSRPSSPRTATSCRSWKRSTSSAASIPRTASWRTSSATSARSARTT